MTTTFHQVRCLLIAFAALVAASSATSAASVCPTMNRGGSVCGCCAVEASAVPATRLGVAGLPAAPMACVTLPGGGCACCVQGPAAPAPGPDRSTTEGRAKPGANLDFGDLGDDHAARIQRVLRVSMSQGPPKAPLYLRNERLLF